MTRTTATLRFRDVRDSDLDFLQALYASTRADELAQTDWSEAEKRDFLAMQFQAQHQHYTQHYGDDSFQLILDGDTPIGRLYLGRWPSEVRIIDISLVPERRGLGIGTALLQNILDEANKAQKPVRIHVEKFNPALRLYTRLGFRPIEDKGVYLLMERPNAQPPEHGAV